MEIVDLVTYICAALGGVLLLLCIILAAIFLYSVCRKNLCPGSSNRQYVIVPTDQESSCATVKASRPPYGHIQVEQEKKGVEIQNEYTI